MRARAFVCLLAGCSATTRGESTERVASSVHPACESLSSASCEPAVRVPFGLFSPAAAELDALAQSGFTMVGPWYQPDVARAALPQAMQAGLAVVMPVGYPHEQYRDSHEIDWDVATTQRELTDQVRALAHEPAITAWYLLPEELHERDATHLAYLRAATAAIRAADPLGRPILSYNANHRDARRLAPIVAELDIATKGAYANFAGYRDERAWVRWSIDELQAAGDKPAWVLPEMFEEPAADADVAAWVRHDVYAGLVAGATGVLVFSGWRRPDFERYDEYLRAYRDVANELNGRLGLGAVILRGETCEGAPIEIIAGPAAVEFRASGSMHVLPTLGRLDVVHNGARWTFLVNSSNEMLTVRAPAFAQSELMLGAEYRTDAQTLALPRWGVAALRVAGS